MYRFTAKNVQIHSQKYTARIDSQTKNVQPEFGMIAGRGISAAAFRPPSDQTDFRVAARHREEPPGPSRAVSSQYQLLPIDFGFLLIDQWSFVVGSGWLHLSETSSSISDSFPLNTERSVCLCLSQHSPSVWSCLE